MGRYELQRLYDEGKGTENYPEANAPTDKDIENLFEALEDCLNAARQISIHSRESYFQYYNIMCAVDRRYERLPKSYQEAVETIAMHAGETVIGKRFVELEKANGEISDRTWYKRAFQDVTEILLTKKIKRKKFWGF